jgi:hypothetical protein
MKTVNHETLITIVAVLGICESGVRGGAIQKTASTDRVAVILLSTKAESDLRLTTASDGVLFDLDGSGIRRRVGWTAAGSDVAMLAIDVDGDGEITSGKELITNRSIPGSSNCFAALRVLAMRSNGGVERGSVTSDDPPFERLLLWRDSNHNGIGEPTELVAVGQSFSAIGLGYVRSPRDDQNGNRFGYRGWAHVRTGPGRNGATGFEDNKQRTRETWEVYLAME